MKNTNTKVPYGIGQKEFDSIIALERRTKLLKSLLLNSNYGNWNYEQRLENMEVEVLIQMEKTQKLLYENLSDHAKLYRIDKNLIK
jgi:hypothetical protein|tara:strand:+ start:279 stop:536 length:258 start_codon:yes stop_codon:yes gene_type:complete